MVLEQLDMHMEKNKSQFLPCTMHINQFEMDHITGCKAKTIRILEETIREYLYDLQEGKDFLRRRK